MATLSETIQGTSGLLAYWPLYNSQDQSGNGRHLTASGAVNYAGSPLNRDSVPSASSLIDDGILKIAQATLPKIVALECWFRLPGNSAQNSLVFGTNQPPTGTANRFILFYYGTSNQKFCTFEEIFSPGTPRVKTSAQTYAEMSGAAHHLVAQFDSTSGSTQFYIDGVLDTGLTVPLDIFLQVAGSNLTFLGYLYSGDDYGIGNASHAAIYSRKLTPEEIAARQPYALKAMTGEDIKPPIRVTAIAANQETRAQFQPQDITWRGGPGFVYPGPMPSPPVRVKPLCQGQDLTWLRDGVQNVLQGYIESTVTISGIGVRRRVLCLDQAGNLLAETMSRASDGKYRFDLLWPNRRYMLVAQDEPAFGAADYNAVAADFQQPTPYAPGEGVGLTGG
ncbi:LamG-like jellyroll fold domain-containing protein [Aeromonas media]|uniref:LamG-like jellyroll fold domain-containing protein n=1 Tax=Aeromonas media TaxID=651 RepID=UPI0038D1B432